MISISFQSKIAVAILLLLSLATGDRVFAAQIGSNDTVVVVYDSSNDITRGRVTSIFQQLQTPRNCPMNKKRKWRGLISIGIFISALSAVFGIINNDDVVVAAGIGGIVTGLFGAIALNNFTRAKCLTVLCLLCITYCIAFCGLAQRVSQLYLSSQKHSSH